MTIRYLVPDSLSPDTVECLEQLHHQAKQGRVTGIAFICYLRGRPFIANTAGEAKKNPVLTRGMLLELLDKLSSHAAADPT